MLSNKIDFAVIINVQNANPNGDPLNENRPRVDYGNRGEISDVCLKRKIRDRLLENGESIFVQSNDRKVDNCLSLRSRAEDSDVGLGKDVFNIKKDVLSAQTALEKTVCAKWFDVRAFGQMFPYKGKDKGHGTSIGIRGPVSIQHAFSTDPISIVSTQITKSVNGEGNEVKKSADTMGTKHRVEKATYELYGSINPQLSIRTGFSDDDAETLKSVLPKLFENDASSARPAGSMEVIKVIWWKHNSKGGQYSSAKVHRSLDVKNGGDFTINTLQGLEPEIIDGF